VARGDRRRTRRRGRRPLTGRLARALVALGAFGAAGATACIVERGPSPDSARAGARDSGGVGPGAAPDGASGPQRAAPRRDTLVALDARQAAPADTTRRGDPPVTAADLEDLRRRGLLVPVAGVPAARILDTFGERRGERPHAALDIPAPRGTPVLSADAGRVLKLHTSRGGGLTVYVGDLTGRFIFYYAHLDGYRAGLAEGELLRRGAVLGYVGTTGNAPPNVPHLHFAIARAGDMKRWWAGTPVDPRPFLVGE
jgi:murein DD-endopeptidase MepM/ murein hydrolase activator NlpD